MALCIAAMMIMQSSNLVLAEETVEAVKQDINDTVASASAIISDNVIIPNEQSLRYLLKTR